MDCQNVGEKCYKCREVWSRHTYYSSDYKQVITEIMCNDRNGWLVFDQDGNKLKVKW